MHGFVPKPDQALTQPSTLRRNRETTVAAAGFYVFWHLGDYIPNRGADLRVFTTPSTLSPINPHLLL